MNSRLPNSLDERVEGGGEAEIGEDGGMEAMGDLADVGVEGLQLGAKGIDL